MVEFDVCTVCFFGGVETLPLTVVPFSHCLALPFMEQTELSHDKDPILCTYSNQMGLGERPSRPTMQYRFKTYGVFPPCDEEPIVTARSSTDESAR